MTFTYDPDLGTTLSRARALLLDTSEGAMLFSDEAYANYFDLFGVDQGTANLAVILLNKYAQQPTQAAIPGLGSATWGDRLAAWRDVIASAESGGVEGGDGVKPALLQVRVVDLDDPYAYRDKWTGVLLDPRTGNPEDLP